MSHTCRASRSNSCISIVFFPVLDQQILFLSLDCIILKYLLDILAVEKLWQFFTCKAALTLLESNEMNHKVGKVGLHLVLGSPTGRVFGLLAGYMMDPLPG